MKALHTAARAAHLEMAGRYDELPSAIRSHEATVDELGRTTA